ncbi:MAG: glycosyltransferase family 2 protein [Planctomycetota bacterium]|jgi:GT2 family glycosyltransferase
MSELPKISVIIPNRDGKIYLKTCLDSLLAQSLKPHEIIVVDDASADNSFEYVKVNYTSVIVIKSSETNVPQGFSGGVNAGIEKSSGDYIALLNNDTETDPDWLKEMYEAIIKYPEAGSCSCKMYLKDGTHINALGLMLEKGGSCRTIADGIPDDGQFDEEREIFGPSGGAALWKKEVLDDIGIFEHDYFAYCEDADLAFRARAAGYISVYAPKSKMIHLEGRCPSLARFDKVALRLRNTFWFVWTNFPSEMIAGNLKEILWETLFRHMFKYGPRLWKVEGRSFWKAFLSIIISIPAIIKMRTKRSSKRKAAAEKLLMWLGCNPFDSKNPSE